MLVCFRAGRLVRWQVSGCCNTRNKEAPPNRHTSAVVPSKIKCGIRTRLYEALAAEPALQPDLIVGHSGFASTLFLRELYDLPDRQLLRVLLSH